MAKTPSTKEKTTYKNIEIFKVKVIPKNQSDAKVGFVSINSYEFGGKRVVIFDKPIYLSQREINILKGLKNITSETRKRTLNDIMEDYKVPLSKAKEIMEQGELGSKVIKTNRFEIIML